MAAADTQGDEKTENATVFRREEFRRQGSVALSRELVSIALFAGVGLSLYMGVGNLSLEWQKFSNIFFQFSNKLDLNKTQFLELNQLIVVSLMKMCAPVVLTAAVMGFIVTLCQVGFVVSWEPLAPNLERINPVSGLQRIFSMNGSIEAVKALIKMVVAGWILWLFLKSRAYEFTDLYHKSVPEIAVSFGKWMGRLLSFFVVYFGAIAGLDYFFQRYMLEKKMKMTKQEVKEEFKMREGDPLIKQRIKGIQRRIASQRMMEEVPKAAVIVTNPTHLAVALQYDPLNMHAPKIVAKGAGFVADKIKEIARQNGIPIVENKPLARTVFKSIKIGHFIPRELYKAVSEVLAYVYRLKGLTQQRRQV